MPILAEDPQSPLAEVPGYENHPAPGVCTPRLIGQIRPRREELILRTGQRGLVIMVERDNLRLLSIDGHANPMGEKESRESKQQEQEEGPDCYCWNHGMKIVNFFIPIMAQCP